LKKHLILKIVIASFFVFIASVLIEPQGKAAQTDNNFMKDISSILHLELDEGAEVTDMTGMVNRERLYDKVLYSTSRLRISLSDHLKLFFNFQPAIKYYPGTDKDTKSRTMFGMDIFF
jgi:hypothetical protein